MKEVAGPLTEQVGRVGVGLGCVVLNGVVFNTYCRLVL